jgi:iron complex transport system ATP-binding protein
LTCLLGVNGAGKSTLMRTIAGLQKALGGEVAINGRNVHSMPALDRARELAVVLTERLDAGFLDVYSLVALGRSPFTNWSGKLSDADHRVIRDSLAAVEAEELASRLANELSDGERQRVMMARALAQEPKAMLLDELTAFLDLSHRIEIMELLRKLAHEQGKTIIASTHDLDLALRVADEVWLLAQDDSGGPGIVHAGAPEDLVLQGVFGHAFESPNVAFDPYDGRFRLRRNSWRDVSLLVDEALGGSVQEVWTRRLLERLGYRIEAGCERQLHLRTHGAGAIWLSRLRGTEQHLPNLSVVAGFLRTRAA